MSTPSINANRGRVTRDREPIREIYRVIYTNVNTHVHTEYLSQTCTHTNMRTYKHVHSHAHTHTHAHTYGCVAGGCREPISEIEKKRVINKAKRCVQWAQDADRPPVPGAANMTDDQV